MLFVIGLPLNSMLLLLYCLRRRKSIMVIVVINVNKFMSIQTIYMNNCLKSGVLGTMATARELLPLQDYWDLPFLQFAIFPKEIL